MFSERLKILRTQANMSQKELAEHLFVSQQSVAKWETDKSTPNPDMIARIAELFGVSSDYLLGISESRSSNLPHDPKTVSAKEKEGPQSAPLNGQEVKVLALFSSLPEAVKQHALQYLDLLASGTLAAGGAQLSEAQREILVSRTEEIDGDQNNDSRKDAG